MVRCQLRMAHPAGSLRSGCHGALRLPGEWPDPAAAVRHASRLWQWPRRLEAATWPSGRIAPVAAAERAWRENREKRENIFEQPQSSDMGNPFAPGFGDFPPFFAGRDESVGRMDQDVAQHIVTPVWSGLTPREVEFLAVMASHELPVRSSVMSAAVGSGSRKHKVSLLHKGVIVETGMSGHLSFSSAAVQARAHEELRALTAARDEAVRRQEAAGM